MAQDLIDRWRTLTGELGLAGAAAEDLGRELVARYAEPQRAYHTVRHLEAVLRVLDELAGARPPAPATRLAAWFHDAVYDPRAADNEERSRDLAIERLGPLGVDPAVLDLVGVLVMATKTHETAGSAEADLLLDADLAVLGAPPGSYDAYATGVRQEYAHVDADAFRRGRADVLRHLLDRRAIFTTAAAHARFEAPARRNLTRELAALTAES